MNMTDETWLYELGTVVMTGNLVSPRAIPTRELLCRTTVSDISRPVVTVAERDLGYRYLAAEAAWILSGDNRLEKIVPYAKKMAEFSDDGIWLRGAYGPRYVDQIPYVVQTLRTDLVSRQAVSTCWRERPGPSKDVPCTVALQWLVRNDLLHCVVFMRSSDVWLGLPYDIFSFSMMTAHTLLALRYVDQSFNSVGLGQLYVTAGSRHLYGRNFDAASAIIRANACTPRTMKDLNLDQFKAPQELVDHLWQVAEGERLTRTSWLKETISW